MRQTELKAEPGREQKPPPALDAANIPTSSNISNTADMANTANTSNTSNTANTANTANTTNTTNTTNAANAMATSMEMPAALPIRTTSTIHSSLRVVTNPGELGMGPPTPSAFASGKWTPSLLRSPTSLLLSPLGMAGMKGFKSEDAASNHSGGLLPDLSPSAHAHAAAAKDLPFDARFLAEAWSQESPQSVYALLGQSGMPFSGFSPLAASSPGGSRLLSPMGMHSHHHGLPHGSFQSQLQSFTSHLQSPLMAMSPLAGSGHHGNNNSGNSNSQAPFYPPSVSIPASPHQLNPHLLSPLFASAISPGGGLGVSADMLSMIDPSTVFVPPNSPSAILRHLLPPIVPRSGGGSASLNVKELTLNELRPHFNKPMAVVAKELGVCITLMKKICRRNGLVRWPHRRIRSLVNRITSLQVIAGNSQGAEKKRFQAQINALREELSAVIQNPNEKSRKAQADAKARSPTSGSVSSGRKRGAAKSLGTSSDDDDEEDEDDDDAQEQDENRVTQAKASRPSRQQGKSKQPRKVAASRAATTVTAPPPATSALPPRKRSTRFRPSAVPPPPIKIPRQSEYEAASRQLADEYGERPSSTTSTGSCGKRGSISSILC